MAHENKQNNNGKTLKAVSVVTKSLKKSGKIKGKNKKETKYLKRACTHHYYNKKGKLKADFFNTSNGDCVCNICGRSFPTKLETKDYVREQIETVLGLANQATVAAVAGHLGEKAVDKFVNLKVLLEEFPKDYGRTMKAISKEDNIKKKKNRNKGGNGSNQFGNWNNVKK